MAVSYIYILYIHIYIYFNVQVYHLKQNFLIIKHHMVPLLFFPPFAAKLLEEQSPWLHFLSSLSLPSL